MKQIPDRSGRFGTRPHFEPKELDQMFEKILREFFRPTHGSIPFPIPTDDLTKLIERDTSDFDPGADLSAYGPGVEGVTEFLSGTKPRVRIAAELAYDERRQNRYRTTLTHEYGHVHLHSHIFATAGRTTGACHGGANRHVCLREGIVSAPKQDWLEWQAGYVCGAMLMPISEVLRLACECAHAHNMPSAIGFEGLAGSALLNDVRRRFEVSEHAARIRLIKLDILAS